MAGSLLPSMAMSAARSTVEPPVKPVSGSQTLPAESVDCVVAPALMRIAGRAAGFIIAVLVVVPEAPLWVVSDLFLNIWQPQSNTPTAMNAAQARETRTSG